MPAIHTTRVIHEHTALKRSTKGGESFGQHIDRVIAEKLAKGEMVQTIALEFDESDWLDLLQNGERSAEWRDANV